MKNLLILCSLLLLISGVGLWSQERPKAADQQKDPDAKAAEFAKITLFRSLLVKQQELLAKGFGEENRDVKLVRAAINSILDEILASQKEPVEIKAIAVITPFDKSVVKGWVKFVQKGDEVHITGEVTGLKPGKHGFHIHEFGDISGKDGMTTGGHYNPTKMAHGAPDAKIRHVGDLGNIVADEDGKAVIKMTDTVISLTGAHSIVGRAVLIHADPDDFGQPVGHAGGRLAAGVIGLAK